MRLIFTIVFIFLSVSLFSQEVKILGKIIDAQTKKPVKDAHIIIKGTSKGVVSNVLGFFELKEKLPLTIVVSHLSYEVSSIELTADKPNIKIAIEPSVYDVQKLVFKDKYRFDGFSYDTAQYQSAFSQRKMPSNEQIFTVIEAHCEFPGGIEQFHNYLISQLLTHKDTFDKAFTATMKFTVGTEGKVKVDSVYGISGQVAQLLREIFNAGPNWIPAFQENTPVIVNLLQIIEYDPATKIFTSFEQHPQYIGGIDELYRLILKNLIYPPEAKRSKLQGRVHASFVIIESGTVEDIEIVKGIGSGCDEEAKRVIQLTSGRWIPGYQRGKAIRVSMSIPIHFKL